MSKNKRTLLVIILTLLVVVSASLFATGMILGNSEPDSAQPIFYRMAPDDESRLTQIVLSDSGIQELIKGKDYDINVRGHSIKGQDWNLAVGAILKEDVTAEGFNKWLDEGRKDKSVIKKYVGVLTIVNNDVHNIAIDADNAKVTEISAPQSRFDDRIPELTMQDRERAVTLALNDPRVQELLAGKDYTVAPQGVVIWHSSRGHQKIGASLAIWLDKTYSIEYAWPYPEYDETKYSSFPYYMVQIKSQAVDVKVLEILVDLEKGEVSGIMPHPIVPGIEDLYKESK